MPDIDGAQALAQTLREAIALHQRGQLSQARKKYQQILAGDAQQPDALHLLGLIEHQEGNSQLGLRYIDEAVEKRPNDVDMRFNRANLLQDLQQTDQAIEGFRQVLTLSPEHLSAHLGLGTALRAQHRFDDAAVAYQNALVQVPDSADLHYNLANVWLNLQRPVCAVDSYQHALRLRPGDGATLYNLGNALMELNRGVEALDCYRQALATLGNNEEAFSTLLFRIQLVPDCPPDELYQLALSYASRFEAPLKARWKPHRNKRDPDRRLRVGYVSGDFRQHPVAHFIEPILACHDPQQIEVFGYANSAQTDTLTERIRAQCRHWLPVHALDDDTLAQRIRSDRIDILVDLSGHTALHRLLVFARKPAPVQVTWFGYIGTTGLSAMDYRLTNTYMDPPSLTERYYTETLVRLPTSDIAYQPAQNCPPVNPLPALSGQPLMLGSLNTLSKINPQVIALWSRVLHALPQARLMLGNVPNDEAAQRLKEQFQNHGIDPERLELQPRVDITDYLALHQRIDLGLDPFPYNGGTTTLHALWMGVPVVTLAGSHSVARWGVAALNRVGLPQFIAATQDEYVQCVQRHAADLNALNAIRQDLRARMQAAECTAQTITAHLEAAYREMWRKWCEQPGPLL